MSDSHLEQVLVDTHREMESALLAHMTVIEREPEAVERALG